MWPSVWGGCLIFASVLPSLADSIFQDITPFTEAGDTGKGSGAAFADNDNDGDLDLYLVNWGEENRLLRNRTNDDHWLKVRLRGTASNRMAIGSRVWVRDGERLIASADLQTTSGFRTQAPPELHFGLDTDKAYTVEVRFPSGTRQVVGQVHPGQILTIEEPSVSTEP